MKLNVIPTPREAVCAPADGEPVANRLKTVYVSPRLRERCAAALRFLPPLADAERERAELVVTDEIPDGDRAFFENKNAAEQGYILRGEGGRVFVYAKGGAGAAYGLCTLVQLPATEPDFEIRDYPDFRWRAIKWVLWAEIGMWSYDFGDGEDAFLARIARKLDTCLLYKINLVYFDAWGDDPDRTPQYRRIMLAAGELARERGIRLIFGANTMSYTLAFHAVGRNFGRVHRNVRDGVTYDCIGTFIHDPGRNGGKPYIAGREFGTCLSNDEVTAEKIADLVRFVREVRPGALYLHNMDSCYIDRRMWLARCGECRRRWPNDDVYARDGMAGAFAEYLDRINGALKAEDKDLLIFNVSPGYAEYKADDEKIEASVRFWSAVQSFSRVKEGVLPLFRELYTNKTDGRRRFERYAESLPDGFGVVSFAGGDGFYSDAPVVLSAALSRYFLGADAVLTCSGTAFAEPLALINAEYMWNSEGGAFYRMPDLPLDYDGFYKTFCAIRRGEPRPEEIFGKGGMLEVICRKLYGENGGRMYRYFSLCGENGEHPAPTPCSCELMTNGNRVLLPYRWDNETETDGLIAASGEILRLDRKAREILSPCGDDPDLAALDGLIALNIPLVELIHRYLLLYRDLERYLAEGGDGGALAERIRGLCVFARENADTDRVPVDALGGALARRRELFDALLYNLELMEKSVESGRRIPDGRKELKDENWW